MRASHVRGEPFTVLDTLRDRLPAAGIPWPGDAAAVQRHVSARGHRTGGIVRTLTVPALVPVTRFRRGRRRGRSGA